MPPVRWKILYIITISFQIWIVETGQSNMQDPIIMTSDGWRPIVGSRRPSSEFESFRSTQYKPNSQKVVEVEIVKSENPITITSTVQPEKPEETETLTKVYNNINAGPANPQNTGNKIPPHSKFSSPKYQTLPPSAVTIGRPSQFGFRSHPLKSVKPVGHLAVVPKRKVVRGQAGAHSTRNEVYIHPATALSFPFIKQGPSNVRTRETQGLGLFGSANHFTVNQPNAHVEINRFPSYNDNIFEQYKSPGVAFLIPKLNSPQDEYSRNLVPPPPRRNLAEKEKLKNSKIPAKFKDNVATISEPILEVHEQFGAKNPQVQENLVQIPLGFDQNFVIQKQFKQPKIPSEIDVQVTKENLKVYHNILPGRYKPNGAEYVDYDYHGIPSPVQLPKLQTYEVTEGKWIDNPNPYTFNFAKTQNQPQNHRNQQPVGPPLLNPQITNEPLVELNLPPFLPTPYRPDPALPTSPTQSEVSTVFSQVSKKMNKFKNAELNNNPLFFNIKEVSTHYPILGKPEFIQETQTDIPAKENEIVNEVTTQSEELTTRKRRRRPQPRRPTPPSTTTTEEPQQTEIYEVQKTQEQEVNNEKEKPPKRQRQRPNRYRQSSLSVTRTTTPEYQDSQDSQDTYRTTTPSTEYEENSGEKRLRGRNRYRQKVKDQPDNKSRNQSELKTKEQSDHRNSLYRKRTRPTTTEMPTNHKFLERDNTEQTDNTNFESKYFQNTEETPIKFEYDDGSSGFSNEEKSESYESTPANQLADVMVRLHVDEKGTIAPEETTMVNVHNPENEIDSTTLSGIENDQGEPTHSTLATTIPTTTPTESKVTTTKPSRVKTRPTLFKSNRPRFSVKDYRQRLTQYTSSTPSTTTDISRTASEGNRFRFPSRARTRPTQSTTTVTSTIQEEMATEPVLRRRFKPKDPRHKSTETSAIISENSVKSVNTRLRPFDRYKTSTETSVKPKVSIKPSIYQNRRRTTAIKSKLSDKENQTVTVKDVEIEEKSSQEDEDNPDVETTTVYQSSKITTTEVFPLSSVDISDDDYSQRISDLTSSFKTEYDTPGLFKSVAPISRRVPNYFTISTEDPILPIEAFFPGIKEKDKDSKE